MNLSTSTNSLQEAKGSFTAITLNDRRLECMLVYIGQENNKWLAKVKVKLHDKYLTRTGQSNSHQEEAIKRALLSVFAEVGESLDVT